MKLETERLRFRDFTSGDLNLLIDLDTDPEVMRYISDGVPTPVEQLAPLLERIIKRNAELAPLGTWVAELKETGEAIGWFTLKPLPGLPDIEVGCRLLKKHWGKGFATEGTKLLLEYGFDTLGLKKIVAITHPDNKASQNVLKKNGLVYIDERKLVPSISPDPITLSWLEIERTK